MKTIAAISTATGNSGIGIIRMSGENLTFLSFYFLKCERFQTQKVIIVNTHINGSVPGLVTCIESIDFHSNTLRQIYQLSSFYR